MSSIATGQPYIVVSAVSRARQNVNDRCYRLIELVPIYLISHNGSNMLSIFIQIKIMVTNYSLISYNL